VRSSSNPFPACRTASNWRVHDHCRRTGKTCVLVDKPDALRVVRIRRQDDDGTPVARAIEFTSN